MRMRDWCEHDVNYVLVRISGEGIEVVEERLDNEDEGVKLNEECFEV